MIKLIATGKIKDRRLSGLIEDYQKRVRPLAPLEIIEIKDSNPEKEAKDMTTRLGSPGGQTLVIAMDEHGDDLTSKEFSRVLGKHGSISFLIGGPDGLGSAARERAGRTIRLSSMTLTHEMARTLLVEQIYRGLSILRGKPYHRE
ncbi:MAG: 23S rRNA (pseudouridine(1915)-N(3))-methyltransferase RlmH [Gemmatimonadales bacterium]|nr:23S rRNA (pseudouridine(1915)-N(3))-methyltransferase RlmH [Gemmatimonadales bacterium]